MTDCHEWSHKVWEPLSDEPCFANEKGQVYQLNVGFRVVQTGNRIIAILPNYELARIAAEAINKKLGFSYEKTVKVSELMPDGTVR